MSRAEPPWLEWQYQYSRVRILEYLAEATAQRMRGNRPSADRAVDRAIRVNPFFYVSICHQMTTRLIPTPSDPAWTAHMDQEHARLEELRSAAAAPPGS